MLIESQRATIAKAHEHVREVIPDASTSMFSCNPRTLELVRSRHRSSADVYVDLHDRAAAALLLQPLKGDYLMMSRLRTLLAETECLLFRRSDDEVINMLAAQLATGQLLMKDPDQRPEAGATAGRTTAVSQPPVQRPTTGYFTMLKYILRARSFEHLEDLTGYRRGRLSAKGLLIYRFLRLPEISEFEVRGSTITPEQKWNAEDRKTREAELAKTAAYHQNTKVPSFDEIQKRNARSTMAVAGDNTLVKLYPLDSQPIDATEEGYPPGHGIPQWRLTDDVKRNGSIVGTLLFRIDPSGPLPWVE